jgi:RHS repeat-associated protein
MNSFSFGKRLSLSALPGIFSCLVLSLALSGISAQAQSSGSRSATDGTTPLGMAPGAPEGAYALSGFDNINLFSRNLNFRLPLLHIGGRGGAAYTMMLPIEKHWRVIHTQVPTNCGQGGCTGEPINKYLPVENGWSGIQPGYGAGVMGGRASGDHFTVIRGAPDPYNPQGSIICQYFRETLTRLTFTAPDGTEYEFRDQLYGGQPKAQSCNSMVNRGKVFVSADGSATTFVSDSDIMELSSVSGVLYPTGYLLMPDGTRYRIEQGFVSWIRDCNGNQLAFSYDNSGRVSAITDSLNRQVTIIYQSSGQSYDEISFKGFGGAQRTIRVTSGALDTPSLRTDYLIQTYRHLFPELNYASDAQYRGTVVQSIALPDSASTGRQYTFKYDSYGTLARVELPTGGAIEYDYANGSGTYIADVNTDGTSEYGVNRSISERRVYSDGTTLTERTTYSGVDSSTSITHDRCIVVAHLNTDGSPISHEKHYFYSYPSRRMESPNAYPAWNEGKEYKTEVLDANGTTVLRRVENAWRQRAAVSWWNPSATPHGEPATAEPANDPRLVETITTLDNNQVSKRTSIDPGDATGQTVGFDQYNNQTDVWEYDYGAGTPGPLLRHTHTDYLTINPINGSDYASPNPTNSSIYIRHLPQQQSIYDANEIERARITYEYDQYTADAHHAALLDCPNISGQDTAFTTAYGTRGNPTAVTRYLLTKDHDAGSISVYSQYDIAGNVVKLIDGRGNATTVDFTDRFGVPDRETRSNSAPAELGGQYGYGFPTGVTNALGQTAYTQFDYYLGKPVNGEDVNGVVSSGSYDDLLDRPRQIIRDVNNLAAKGQTTFNYDAASRLITTTGDLNSYGDNLLKSETLYDGLGRTTETRHYETSTSYITNRQAYDALGRVAQSSNPFRQGEAIYWSSTGYDALGRVKSVTTPDNAVVNTDYNGNRVLVRDQAGKKRLSQTNALDQLTDVWEITASGAATMQVQFGAQTLNGYLTHYNYDALGNLQTVLQGYQTRTFEYDSLGRLTSATNPESGTISYQYDGNSNLVLKLDPRTGGTSLPNCSIAYTGTHLATCYEYDALNRIKSRTYNDNAVTPSVNYKYDSQVLPIGTPSFERGASTGRLVATLYGGETSTTGNYYGYDALGRVKRSLQVTSDGQANQTYRFPNYDYDVAGNLKSETYPSGRVMAQGYDVAGRLKSVTAQQSTGEQTKTYADSISYWPGGAVKDLRLGNQLWEHTELNLRLQPTEIDLGTQATAVDRLKLAYGYETRTDAQSSHDNNGNVLSQTITVPTIGTTQGFTATQTYGYDALNRLSSLTETGGLSQGYSYDRYGNRAVTAGYVASAALTPQSLSAFNAKTNQIAASSYDVAGNQQVDAASRTFSYDAENHQRSFNNGAALYSYDGDGRRAKKVTASGTTIYVYDARGQMVVEYSNATPGNVDTDGTSYLTSDTLGTPRVITGSGGQVKARHDYLPFGEEISINTDGRSSQQGYVYGSGSFDNLRQKFTGKERDGETGLDYFGARYYASTQGRFTSPDPLMASGTVENPQSWNRYSYVLNHSLEYTDPFGLYVFDPRVSERDREKFRAGLSKARSNLWKIAATYGINSKEYKKAARATNAYGAEGVKNGVTIFSTTDPKAPPGDTAVAGTAGPKTADNPTGQDIRVTFTSFGGQVIAHEGSHVADGSEWVASGFANSKNPTNYQTEFDAFTVQFLQVQADSNNQGRATYILGGWHKDPGKNPWVPLVLTMWDSGWKEANRAVMRANNINSLLERPKDVTGYDVTPSHQGGPAFQKGTRFK